MREEMTSRVSRAAGVALWFCRVGFVLCILSIAIGISPVNLSRIRTGKINAVRFSTLEAMCRALDCQPEDLLEYIPDDEAPEHMGLTDEG